MDGSADPPWPDDAIEVGRIVDAWGVRGDIKVQPYSGDPQALFSSRRWFLKPPEPTPPPGDAQPMRWPPLLRITRAREQAGAVVASASELSDRNAAEALKGARIFVARASFPTPADDEFYWVDLIGLAVVNREGLQLGEVAGLIDTGAHSVLRVQPGGDAEERLIPFVAAYIDGVDVAERRIRVDWQADY